MLKEEGLLRDIFGQHNDTEFPFYLVSLGSTIVNKELEKLPERSREIVSARYERRRSLERVGHLFHLSRERIRQILSGVFAELKEPLGNLKLDEQAVQVSRLPSLPSWNEIDNPCLCSCFCGKYSYPFYRGIICDKCGSPVAYHFKDDLDKLREFIAGQEYGSRDKLAERLIQYRRAKEETAS